MSRPVRIEYPGAHYHVTSKGIDQRAVFLDDEDRAVFLNVVDNVVNRFGWLLHSYVLMDNHYHLVVEVPGANLSKGMRQLNGVYTQHFNRRHDSEGSLFQGRFRSVLFESENFLLPLCRHVVLNPVRVNSTRSPHSWRWSSYRANGLGQADPLLRPHPLYLRLARSKAERLAAYRALFRSELDNEAIGDIRLALHQGQPLGNSRFLDRIERVTGQRCEAKPRGRPRKQTAGTTGTEG